MAQCVISAKLPPLIDATRTPLAYGDRALPRLNRELNDPSLLLRQRALRSLSDHLHDPEHIVAAISEGITATLRGLLHDVDDTIRQLTTECLYVMASHASGRDALINCNVILPLSKLFADSVSVVRYHSLMTLRNLAETPVGANAIVDAHLVHVLVSRIEQEEDDILCLILDTLHFLFHINTSIALTNGAMDILTALLTNESKDIRAKAARDIMDLSVPLAGKETAVASNTVPPLVELLKDTHPDVRANAAGALMFITITTKGKYTAIHCGALAPLVELVNDRTSEVRLNAVKALTCLSDAPEGREELLKHVERIRDLEFDAIPSVAKAATRAVQVITWLPGNPYYK